MIRTLRRLLRRPAAGGADVDAALALWTAGRLEAAEVALRAAIAAGHAEARVLHALGAVLVGQRRLSEGLAALRLATETEPGNAGYWIALGKACASGRLADDAIDAFLRALELRPDLLEVEALLHKPLLDTCDWHRVEVFSRRLCERANVLDGANWTRALDPWIALALPIEPRMRREAARQHARRIAARAAALPRPARGPRTERPRLRLGYLSADLREHAVAQLAAGLFEQHERDRFEVFAYSLGGDDRSAHRRRLVAAFDRFHDLHGRGAAEIAQLIADDGVDILVDLNGYTTGGRPEVLALRPAPVCAQYLGFPGSMQADFVDYVIADRIVAPAGEAGEFSEAVVRMPASYQANDDRQAIAAATPSRAACGLPETGFVYCCFNQNFKIERPVFAAWMRILAAVPGSVLWLFKSSERAQGRLREAAAGAGVDPARLVFAGWMAKPEHLARHRLADLFLDTRTYNAHTTASDALWSGLPVLTCPGRDFAGRVSSSLLHAVGLPELIVPDLAAYEATAIALAAADERRRELRARLAANRTALPLFQTRAFARAIERAYEEMWRVHAAGQPPSSFALA